MVLQGDFVSKPDTMEPRVVTPRICFKQIYCQNLQLESNGNYYCVTVAVPLLDHLMSDVETRFPGDNLTAYFARHIIPYNMFATSNTRRKEFLVFVNFCSENMP